MVLLRWTRTSDDTWPTRLMVLDYQVLFFRSLRVGSYVSAS